jgi:hypothetical protein
MAQIVRPTAGQSDNLLLLRLPDVVGDEVSGLPL